MGALTLLWCGFALGGASGTDESADAKVQSDEKDEVKVVIVVQTGDAETSVNGEVIVLDRLEGAPVGRTGAIFIHKVAGVGLGDHGDEYIQKLHEYARKKLHLGINGQDGKKFAEDHPSADVDFDGTASRIERGAYLTALAMTAPASVLEQFPKADRDEDGLLAAIEAARLVSGPLMLIHAEHMGRRPIVAFGKVGNVEGETESNGQRVVIRIEGDGGGDAEQEADVVKWLVAGQGDQFALPHMQKLQEHVLAFKGKSPADWLIKNIEAELTTYDVAQYLDVAEQAPFLAILDRHPEADLDGDGNLSVEERDAFKKSMFSNALMWTGDCGEALDCGMMKKHMFKFNAADMTPGRTVEEFIDENGNVTRRVKIVKIQDGRVEVTIEETTGEPDGSGEPEGN